MKSFTRSVLVRLFSGAMGTRLGALCVTMLVLGMSSAAFASGPPAPVLRKTHPAWIGYVVIFVLLVMVTVVSLMPSKRSHQD